MAAVTKQSTAVASGLRIDDRKPGVVICRTADYEADAAYDANSVVEMVPVPKGAQILDIHTFIADAGAGRSADIGDGNLVDSIKRPYQEKSHPRWRRCVYRQLRVYRRRYHRCEVAR